MKTLKTQLTEQQFLNRLTRLCRQKEKRDKGYMEQNTFVFDRKQTKFWLGTNHAVGGRSPGLTSDRLNASYRVGDDGFVTVSYRRAKHPVIFVPHAVVGVLGVILAVSVLADVLNHRAVSGSDGVMALFFLGFFASGFWANSKDLAAQEEHLRYICGLDGRVEEGDREMAIPDLDSIREREVYPLLVRYGGRDYRTLFYYLEGEDEESLLHSGEELLYFRNRAQLDRFCAEMDLRIADDESVCDLDHPIPEEGDHGHILKCWNQLHTVARVLSLPFEGDDPSHDGLYEALFQLAMPMSSDTGERRLGDEQIRELEIIFADKEKLMERFRLWRE